MQPYCFRAQTDYTKGYDKAKTKWIYCSENKCNIAANESKKSDYCQPTLLYMKWNRKAPHPTTKINQLCIMDTDSQSKHWVISTNSDKCHYHVYTMQQTKPPMIQSQSRCVQPPAPRRWLYFLKDLKDVQPDMLKNHGVNSQDHPVLRVK